MTKKEQYALVTGGTSGIGYELAKLLAKDGYNLLIVARNQEELNKTTRDLQAAYNIEVVTLSRDLFDKKAPFEIYDQVIAKGLQIDILVNNAGQGQYGEFIDTDLEKEMDIIQLNITSLVALTKLFLRDMIARKSGKILNVASVASKIPGPLQSVYHGTKAFVHSFTEAIRNEVKDSGVTITSLLPGATATDFFNKADMLNAKNVQDGKLADPAEVAKDGYNALMNDDDMVISGLANKIQVAMSNILPDAMVAEKVHNQQAPKNETEQQSNN
ncbi:MAG: SDR family oxidoreductase [Ferruginibacter sp.]